MHEREPDQNMRGKEEGPEEQVRPQQRIYVASLADYNEGRLHGAWIDAAQTAGEIMDAVRDMLRASPCPHAEEWAIHDYEGFGPLTLSESEDFQTVAELAAGIARHGEAFAAWADHIGAGSELLDTFEDAYMGEYDSGADYAEEELGEAGIEEVLDQLPESLRPYISVDYEAYFDDLVSNGEITSAATSRGGVYVFRIW